MKWPSAVRLVVCLAALRSVHSQPSPEAQRRVDEATSALRAALLLNPSDADGYRKLAETYIGHKFLRAASGALASAVALAPGDAAGWRELGALRRKARDLKGAAEAFLSASQLAPGSGEVLVELAHVSPDPDVHLQ